MINLSCPLNWRKKGPNGKFTKQKHQMSDNQTSKRRGNVIDFHSVSVVQTTEIHNISRPSQFIALYTDE